MAMSRRPSVVVIVRCQSSSIISKIFSSETAWPITAKLHVEHPKEGGTKVYINSLGHMTKMAILFVLCYGKVQVGKDQEKAQSEKDSHSKNRGGEKPN